MLIRRPGQPWHPLQPALHDERALQTLLVQSPSLLPSPGPGELAVAANFRIGSTASVDLLGVGVDGRVVLVECGRQEGPGRRPMGGAALAVGAGLWRAPYEEFDRAFAVRAGVPLIDKAAGIARAGGLGWDESAFRAAVTENLASGRFQLILAVDVVSDEVRQVVAYLNAGARPGLAAVALGLRYHAEEGVELLIPTVFRGEGGREEPTGDSGRDSSSELALPATAAAPEPAGIQASSIPARPTAVPTPAPAPSGTASGPAPKASATPPASTTSVAPPATAGPPPTANPGPATAPASGSSSPFARPAAQEAEAPATSSDPAVPSAEALAAPAPEAAPQPVPAAIQPEPETIQAAPEATQPVARVGQPEATTPAPAEPGPTRVAPRPAAAPVGGQGEHALFAALEASCLPAAVDAVRRLYHIARDRGRELQWGHGEHPAVTAVYEIDGKAVGLWSCYTDLKPSFVINFEWLAPHVEIERLQRLADRLAELPSVPERIAGLAEAGYKRRLALAVNAVLAQPGAADVINSAFTDLLNPDAAQTGTTATAIPPPPPAATASRGGKQA